MYYPMPGRRGICLWALLHKDGRLIRPALRLVRLEVDVCRQPPALGLPPCLKVLEWAFRGKFPININSPKPAWGKALPFIFFVAAFFAQSEQAEQADVF